MIAFAAPLWLWSSERGGWHFITVPDAPSSEIRAESFANRGGFGSIKVEASIGNVTWRTSIFPRKEGDYLLPVKSSVRREAGLVTGDEVTVTLSLL